MSSKAPELERVPTQMPPTATPPRTGRARRAIWIAVILALIVGAVGGYFLRWGTEPTKTETQTQTVIQTVTPPAYTTSTNVAAQVTFDGKSCMYSGPGELQAGTTMKLTCTAGDLSAQPSALVVWYAMPGTTYEEVRQYLAKPGSASPAPPFVVDYRVSHPVSTANQTLRVPLTEGLWGVTCNTSPESTDTGYYGAMLRVVPS